MVKEILREADEPRGGVQSVEVAIRVLEALTEGQAAMPLREVARRTDMPASKVHRYLQSLVRGGLVDQEPNSGRYCLGGLALRIGLVALAGVDVVRLGMPIAQDLKDRLGETVLLATWSDRGPVVVGWEISPHPISVGVRVGSVLPLLRSASGRVFLGSLPHASVAPVLNSELSAMPAAQRAVWSEERITSLRRSVGATGLGIVAGDLLPGVAALSAPVHDHNGRVVAALTCMGYQGVLEVTPKGRAAQSVKEAAARLSQRLGYSPHDAVSIAQARVDGSVEERNAHVA
jgi:DNA-binding IclR family transcriptional regulator